MTYETMSDIDGSYIDWDGQTLKLDIPPEYLDLPYDGEVLHPDFCDWWEPV